MKDKTTPKTPRRKTSAAPKALASPPKAHETRYFFFGQKVMDEIKILARLASPKGQEGKS
jgi:hypothetical protein